MFHQPRLSHEGTIVRKLIIFSAALGLTAAIALPALAAGPRGAMRAPTTRSHWFAGTVTAVGTDSLSVGVLWTGSHDSALDGQSLTLAVGGGTTILSGPNHTPEPLASIQNGDL